MHRYIKEVEKLTSEDSIVSNSALLIPTVSGKKYNDIIYPFLQSLHVHKDQIFISCINLGIAKKKAS